MVKAERENQILMNSPYLSNQKKISVAWHHYSYIWKWFEKHNVKATEILLKLFLEHTSLQYKRYVKKSSAKQTGFSKILKGREMEIWHH